MSTPAAPVNVELRLAGPQDAVHVASSVARLLRELGGIPPPEEKLADGVRAVLARPHEVSVILAVSSAQNLVGLLGVSWQWALRTAGPYGLIQELWVDSAARGRGVGSQLLAQLTSEARARGVRRIEVGLPGERYPQLSGTERFYLSSSFAPIGSRMRLTL
jgi:ribosomal protein S18 acetylase RimI-like enzyme